MVSRGLPEVSTLELEITWREGTSHTDIRRKSRGGLECVRSRNPTDTAGAAVRGGRGGYHELRDGQGSNWQDVGVFYSKCGEKPFKGLHI